MRILALNPYHGGSHEQFLTQWIQWSSHEFTVRSMPPRHFKWRIRQAAYGLAVEANKLLAEGARFDAIFTTSMLDAAELRGFLSPELRSLPLVVLFHENQFVYPTRKKDERDVQFGLINWASALSADAVWFNSAYNRDSFLEGAERLLRKMPDERSLESLDVIRNKSQITHLGIDVPDTARRKDAGPLHLAWVARWEHDKRPDIFLNALKHLHNRKIDFRLSCLGQSFRTIPQEFEELKATFGSQLVRFGFEKDRSSYFHALAEADCVVTTADHEFFGLALLEAVRLGCIPVAPRRLVYPELYPEECLFDGEGRELSHHLQRLSQEKAKRGSLEPLFASLELQSLAERFSWRTRAAELDQQLIRVAS